MTFYRSIMGFIMPALVNTEEFHNFAAPSGEHRFIALLDDWKDTLKLIELSGPDYNLSFRCHSTALSWVLNKPAPGDLSCFIILPLTLPLQTLYH